jgi:hypothetical protein
MDNEANKGAKAKNQDIRNFFQKNAVTNKRAMKLVEPFINDIDNENYKLRERKIINYKDKFDLSSKSVSDNEEDKNKEEIFNDEKDIKQNSLYIKKKRLRKKKNLKNKKRPSKKINKEIDEDEVEFLNNSADDIQYEEGEGREPEIPYEEIDFIELKKMKNFHKIKSEINKTISEATHEIDLLEKDFFINEFNISNKKSRYPDDCVPISTDVRTFDFNVNI